jgi:hypothetical protein
LVFASAFCLILIRQAATPNVALPPTRDLIEYQTIDRYSADREDGSSTLGFGQDLINLCYSVTCNISPNLALAWVDYACGKCLGVLLAEFREQQAEMRGCSVGRPLAQKVKPDQAIHIAFQIIGSSSH